MASPVAITSKFKPQPRRRISHIAVTGKTKEKMLEIPTANNIYLYTKRKLAKQIRLIFEDGKKL